jgi:hypothetical protein
MGIRVTRELFKWGSRENNGMGMKQGGERTV